MAQGAGTSITNGCESSCGCWDSNLSPLQEQQALFTTQPSLHPLSMYFRFMSSFPLKHLEKLATILPVFLTKGTTVYHFPPKVAISANANTQMRGCFGWDHLETSMLET